MICFHLHFYLFLSFKSLLVDFPNKEASWHFFAEKEYDNYPNWNTLAGLTVLASHKIEFAWMHYNFALCTKQ